MATDRYIYSVNTLTTEIRQLLEGGLPLIWLEGEVSNFSRPGSGHWYFNLKDEHAQIQCAMFRNANRLAQFTPTNGSQITIRGRLTVYAPRGNYQLIIEHVENSGEGALRRQFEILKKQLETEGLFAAEHKQPLPTEPQRIGVITSPTGAAIRDVIHVLGNRSPHIPIVVYPTSVQGDQAPAQIAQAIQTANARAECDVLIVGRGGGSLEDLWAFNSPDVAYALANSHIPTISAVGHETDTTIADWVADLRAATPSAAAEQVAPDQQQWQRQLQRLAARFTQAQQRQLLQAEQRLLHNQQRLKRQHPQRQLQLLKESLQQSQQRLSRLWQQQQQTRQRQLLFTQQRLTQANPAHQLQQQRQRIQQAQRQLQQAYTHHFERAQLRLQSQAQALHTVSPLATLQRGYSISVQPNAGNPTVVTDAAQVKVGSELHVRLARGELHCEVQQVKTAPATEESNTTQRKPI